MLERRASQRVDADERTHHAPVACVDGGEAAVHVGPLVFKVVEVPRIVNRLDQIAGPASPGEGLRADPL